MTLNDLERRNNPYFAFFTESDCFAGQLRHCGCRSTYNVCRILSAEYCLPVPPTLQRSPSAISINQSINQIFSVAQIVNYY